MADDRAAAALELGVLPLLRIAATGPAVAPALDSDDDTASQALGHALGEARSEGVEDPSMRNPIQGRQLDYHWDGARVDFRRNAGSGEVFWVEAPGAA